MWPLRLACAPTPTWTLLTTMLAGLVDQQVDLARLAGQHESGGVLDVERDVVAAREVVAGAHRQQREGGAGQLVALVEGRDDGVHAAVAAGHHDRAAAGAVQHAVELARVGGLGDLDRRVLAQDGERRGQAFLVGGAGIGVGDHEQGAHGRTIAHRRTGHPTLCVVGPSGVARACDGPSEVR